MVEDCIKVAGEVNLGVPWLGLDGLGAADIEGRRHRYILSCSPSLLIAQADNPTQDSPLKHLGVGRGGLRAALLLENGHKLGHHLLRLL